MVKSLEGREREQREKVVGGSGQVRTLVWGKD